MISGSRTIAFVVLFGLLLFAAAIAVLLKFAPPQSQMANEPVVTTPQGKPAFAWSYRAFEQAEIPRSTISLAATYPDGTVQTKEVDTIEGGCNTYEERDTDVYPQSTEIICYYAGLGRYYKVVEAEGGYLVQRKVFEEASPDYNPPPQKFETVVKF